MATPPPRHSGRSFSPRAPDSCVKSMPASRATSRNATPGSGAIAAGAGAWTGAPEPAGGAGFARSMRKETIAAAMKAMTPTERQNPRATSLSASGSMGSGGAASGTGGVYPRSQRIVRRMRT